MTNSPLIMGTELGAEASNTLNKGS